MKRLLALALLLAPLAVAGEEEVLSDDWQVVKLSGQESGWAHARVVKRGDIVETTVETEMVMNRGGAEVRMTSKETTEERAEDGAVLRIRSSRNMSNMLVEMDIRFEGTTAILTTKLAGQAREARQEVGQGVVGPYRIERLAAETGLEEGAKFEARTYVADLGGAVDVAVTIGPAEEVELLDGRKEKLVRVETLMKKLGVKPITWADATGKVSKTKISIAGMDMESVSTTEERARKGAATPPAALPDSFANSLLAPLHPIPHPRRVDRATYRIRAKEEMPEFADNRQSVEKEEGGTILLTVARKIPPEGAGRRPLADPPGDLAPCLAASSMVQSDAPEIREIAEKVVAGEADAWNAAKLIERWVHVNVTEKSMGVGFASALEVCRDRKGDCTEHAVLLCALARAAGIPSRVIMGFTCIGNAFGGHAWTEVWVGGEWYALDGTLGHGSADATHITLTRMTMEDAAGPEAMVGLLQGLGNLEIDPVEVVIEGRTLRPATDAGTVEGDRYVSRLWSIAFKCPEGFEFDEPDNRAGMTAEIMQVEGRTAKGTRIEIGIEATDAGVWDMIVSVKGQAFDSCEETEIDGRPALKVAKDDRKGVYVKTDLGVYSFSMQAKGDDAAAVLDALLASVDFDVK
ncbi:MAG: transglutaminase-like domain-containing protein [Planctomycetes bacterium]|nr:transglutaminase-like domain-containing protein [Planctomycetota bacterium]